MLHIHVIPSIQLLCSIYCIGQVCNHIIIGEGEMREKKKRKEGKEKRGI